MFICFVLVVLILKQQRSKNKQHCTNAVLLETELRNSQKLLTLKITQLSQLDFISGQIRCLTFLALAMLKMWQYSVVSYIFIDFLCRVWPFMGPVLQIALDEVSKIWVDFNRMAIDEMSKKTMIEPNQMQNKNRGSRPMI